MTDGFTYSHSRAESYGDEISNGLTCNTYVSHIARQPINDRHKCHEIACTKYRRIFAALGYRETIANFNLESWSRGSMHRLHGNLRRHNITNQPTSKSQNNDDYGKSEIGSIVLQSWQESRRSTCSCPWLVFVVTCGCLSWWLCYINAAYTGSCL